MLNKMKSLCLEEKENIIRNYFCYKGAMVKNSLYTTYTIYKLLCSYESNQILISKEMLRESNVWFAIVNTYV